MIDAGSAFHECKPQSVRWKEYENKGCGLMRTLRINLRLALIGHKAALAPAIYYLGRYHQVLGFYGPTAAFFFHGRSG